jgi:hypothetical protein
MKTHLIAAGVPAKDFGGYISSLAGARGAAGLGVMMQYLDDMKRAYPDLLNSQKKFDEAWAAFQKTPEFKFDKLKAQFNKAMIQVGNVVLPVAIDVANALLNAQKYFDKHPLISKLAIDAALGIFTTALGIKLAGIGISIASKFGVEAALTANAGPIGVAIAVAMYSAWSLLSSKQMPKTSLGYWVNQLLGLHPTTDEAGAPASFGKQIDVVSRQRGSNVGYGVYQAQLSAADAYFKTHHMAEYQSSGAFTKSFQNALNNFTTQNLQGKYSVVVRVK